MPRAFPYGIYDIGRNEGFVNVGTDHDTGAFVVAQGNVNGVRELLEADEANTRVAPKLMLLLHPWAVAAFQDTSDLFKLLYRRVGNWPAEAAVDANLPEMAEAHGHSGESAATNASTCRSSSATTMSMSTVERGSPANELAIDPPIV